MPLFSIQDCANMRRMLSIEFFILLLSSRGLPHERYYYLFCHVNLLFDEFSIAN